MRQVKVGFVGFGEAAHGIGKGLKNCGLETIFAYDKFYNKEPAGQLIKKRAADAKIELLESEKALAECADVILSSVVSKVAVEVAESISPYLTGKHIYADTNAASPMVKTEVAQVILKTGAKFVDCALMGPVPPFLNKVPIFASGNGAGEFKELMTPFAMNITSLGETPGQASAIKMFRSIFMKGYVALLFETLDAANKYNAADMVMENIAETMDNADFMETARLLVTRGLIHSERRAHEMSEVIMTLNGINVSSIMSEASQKKLEWCTALQFKEFFNGEAPPSLKEVLEAFDAKGI